MKEIHSRHFLTGYRNDLDNYSQITESDITSERTNYKQTNKQAPRIYTYLPTYLEPIPLIAKPPTYPHTKTNTTHHDRRPTSRPRPRNRRNLHARLPIPPTTTHNSKTPPPAHHRPPGRPQRSSPRLAHLPRRNGPLLRAARRHRALVRKLHARHVSVSPRHARDRRHGAELPGTDDAASAAGCCYAWDGGE